jgi:tripartite-type tricarboxylate transporter receptor subunit TctC
MDIHKNARLTVHGREWIYTLQYDVEKDFQPIALIATNPQLIVAKKAIAAKILEN